MGKFVLQKYCFGFVFSNSFSYHFIMPCTDSRTKKLLITCQCLSTFHTHPPFAFGSNSSVSNWNSHMPCFVITCKGKNNNCKYKSSCLLQSCAPKSKFAELYKLVAEFCLLVRPSFFMSSHKKSQKS